MNRKQFLGGVAALPFVVELGATSASSLSGDWLGTLTYGSDSEPFALAFKKGKGGKLVAYMWNPAIGVYDLPASHVDVRAGTVTLIEAKVPMRYDGSTLSGQLSSIGDRFELTRATAPLPATPAAPAKVTGTLPALAWQKTVGAVWAAPLAMDGRVYVGDARGILFAFEGATGAVAWTYDTRSAIFGTPSVDGDALLLLDAHDVLHRIDAATGKAIWTRVLGTGKPHDIPALKSQRWDYRSATPVVRDGVAYLGTGSGTFYALDARMGDVRWRKKVGSAIRSTAAIAGGRAIFGSWKGEIVALDLTSGKPIWSRPTGRPITMGVVAYQNVAIVGSRNSLLYGIAIDSGKPVWERYYFTSWVESAPEIVNGIAYIGSSDMHAVRAFDPLTGTVRWNTVVYGWSCGTPLVVDGVVYAGFASVTPYLPGMLSGRCALDASTGSLIWRDSKAPSIGIITGYACDPVLSGKHLVYASVRGDVAAYTL